MYFESNKESLEDDEELQRYILPDGRPNPHWLADGIGDQFSHSLNEIEDYIKFDEALFGELKLKRREAWDILDEFFAYDEVEEEAYNGWEDFMNDKYGIGWEEQFPIA
jgi:hypothetical protein